MVNKNSGEYATQKIRNHQELDRTKTKTQNWLIYNKPLYSIINSKMKLISQSFLRRPITTEAKKIMM